MFTFNFLKKKSNSSTDYELKWYWFDLDVRNDLNTFEHES